MSSFDVTAIINLHREGSIASSTIDSVISAKMLAKLHSVRTEILLILDRSDNETRNVAKNYETHATIWETDFGDLSSARNFAITKASGKYATFVDGDDLWGNKWIYESFRTASKLDEPKTILHPRINLYFGRGISPYYWIHPDMRYENIELIDILAANRWTALSFALLNTYKTYPYVENKLSDGFGYEDWLWHIQTIKEGYIHIAPKDTIHFIRKKMNGSLMQESNRKFALPNIAKIFCNNDLVKI